MKNVPFFFPAAAALILCTSCAQQNMDEFFPATEAQSIEAVAASYDAESGDAAPSEGYAPPTVQPPLNTQLDKQDQEEKILLQETYQPADTRKGAEPIPQTLEAGKSGSFWEGPAEM